MSTIISDDLGDDDSDLPLIGISMTIRGDMLVYIMGHK
jgi:hypothetical protein